MTCKACIWDPDLDDYVCPLHESAEAMRDLLLSVYEGNEEQLNHLLLMRRERRRKS